MNQKIWGVGLPHLCAISSSLCSLWLIFFFSSHPIEAKQLCLGGQTLEVEIADTESARNKGLSGRDCLPEGTGMLFVFDEPQIARYWMKDMTIPLSIAFFDEKQTLINMADMSPSPRGVFILPIYTSRKEARYALEVPQGWFQKHKIIPGMIFYFPVD